MTSDAIRTKMRNLAYVRVEEAALTIERVAGSDAPQIVAEALRVWLAEYEKN
jgi:hypothetical protein